MRVIIHDCHGRMGSVLSELAMQKNHVIYGLTREHNKNNSSLFEIYHNLSELKEPADVLIDFSHTSAVADIIRQCMQKNLRAVICTTGLSRETEDLIQEASKSIALFKSANMSLAIGFINLMLKKISCSLYNLNYDIEIVEKHHNKKLDAPSGTALLLADTINQSLDNKLEFSINNKNHMRAKNELGISSIRAGNSIGEHTIIFAGHGEEIEIKHHADTREIFALGALKASEFILNKFNGLYSIDDLVNNLPSQEAKLNPQK